MSFENLNLNFQNLIEIKKNLNFKFIVIKKQI